MGDVFSTWLQHLETEEILGNVKDSTARTYRKMVELHFRSEFGQHQSDQLSSEAITAWKKKLAERIAKGQLKPKSFNNLITLMKGILKWARRSDQRFLRHDPMEHIARLKKTQTERDILEPVELWRLLRAAEAHPPADVILKTVAFTGVRRGELFGLQW